MGVEHVPYKCSVCGKTFEGGALIVGGKILCPDCSRIYEEIIDECLAEALEKMINGEKVVVDQCLDNHANDISRLGFSKSHFKAAILSRLARVLPRQV